MRLHDLPHQKQPERFFAGLSMVISYASRHSVGWTIVHGLMGWLYVGCYIIKY